jgi:hypothetical protein
MVNDHRRDSLRKNEDVRDRLVTDAFLVYEGKRTPLPCPEKTTPGMGWTTDNRG